MDYLDPQKEIKHRVTLFTGYILISIAIVIGTLVLVYHAYGFGLAKNGSVVQNGLSFFSTHPNPANIYINGKLDSSKTNTRLSLAEGIYDIRLSRDGYRDWQRTIQVTGGGVRHFNYPFLVPKKLVSKKLATFDGATKLMTQSPNHRWLVVQRSNAVTSFDVYDLKNPSKAPKSVLLPLTILSHTSSSESLKFVEWADDNRHVLLQHLYDGKSEYILFDWTKPGQSLNLNTLLSVSPTRLTLSDRKYDHYYLYDAASTTLQAASLKQTIPRVIQQHLLAYRSYSDDTLLFVTDSGASSGQVLVKLAVGTKIYTLRSLPASGPYLLDLAEYKNVLYVALGETNQSKLYIYKDPISQIAKQPKQAIVPVQVLHVEHPNYLGFSHTAQYVVAEHDQQFGTYDIENALGYSFTLPHSVDAPAVHANWMDGDRLTYVSGGKLLMFDYDGTNRQELISASAAFLPGFDPEYNFLYTLSPAASREQLELTQTALLTPADQ